MNVWTQIRELLDPQHRIELISVENKSPDCCDKSLTPSVGKDEPIEPSAPSWKDLFPFPPSPAPSNHSAHSAHIRSPTKAFPPPPALNSGGDKVPEDVDVYLDDDKEAYHVSSSPAPLSSFLHTPPSQAVKPQAIRVSSEAPEVAALRLQRLSLTESGPCQSQVELGVDSGPEWKKQRFKLPPPRPRAAYPILRGTTICSTLFSGGCNPSTAGFKSDSADWRGYCGLFSLPCYSWKSRSEGLFFS